jgi:Fe-S cluster assembly protein SufD
MLEIYADDVKCSHGATVGDLDPDHLFYMRARGIPETEARRLLIDGFVAECFAGLPDEALRETFADYARRWQP